MATRREFHRSVAWGVGAGLLLPAWFSRPGLFAEELAATPKMTEGPFYPDKLPLDTDNDLLILDDSITPAVGEIVYLSGRILTASGAPLRNAFVEIWQVDNNGAYIHSADPRGGGRDKNFQGYGRFLTDAAGAYHFRTLKPVPYPGRTPHIHVAVSRNGQRLLTTQCFIKGHSQNATDGVLRGIRDPAAVERVMVDFKKLAESKIGELAARFDIVLGQTPVENDAGALKGGIGKPEVRRRPR